MCLIVLYANIKEINQTSLFGGLLVQLLMVLIAGLDGKFYIYIYIYILLDGLPGFARIPKRKINQEF